MAMNIDDIDSQLHFGDENINLLKIGSHEVLSSQPCVGPAKNAVHHNACYLLPAVMPVSQIGIVSRPRLASYLTPE